jgi:hypothetical protein
VRQANGDVAINLNATNFKAFINASPKSFTVMKFFAHWSELRQELDSSPLSSHFHVTLMRRQRPTSTGARSRGSVTFKSDGAS